MYLGKIGFWLSFVPWLTFALMFLVQPG